MPWQALSWVECVANTSIDSRGAIDKVNHHPHANLIGTMRWAMLKGYGLFIFNVINPNVITIYFVCF